MEMFNIDVYMDERVVEPFKAISFAAFVVIVAVIVAAVIVLSVFGTLLFLVLLVVGAVAVVTLGTLWPIFIVAVFIWMLSRNNAEAY
jgi:uncharacterized membrane protein